VKAVTPSKSRRNRKPAAALMAAVVGILVTVARAGHELPVYPSYYPHEIAIETMAPQRAADLLRENKLHAYLGPQPPFPGEMPASIRAVETLGSFIVVRLNPASPAVRDGSSACAMIETILRGMAGNGGFVFHPYPVTPLHGDYLYFADLAAATNARFLSAAAARPATPNPKIKADGAQKDLVPPAWIAPGPEWDAAVEAIGSGRCDMVLLTGDSGTGKGVVARLIHQRNVRRSGPFIPVNLSPAAASLLDAPSQLTSMVRICASSSAPSSWTTIPTASTSFNRKGMAL